MNGLSLRPLSAGEVLDQAFHLYRAHFRRLVLVSVSCYAPAMIVSSLLLRGAPQPTSGQDLALGIWYLFGSLVALVFVGVCWSALAKVCDGVVQGSEVTVGGAVRTGARLVPRLILLGILSFILMIAAMIPAMLVMIVFDVIGTLVGLGRGPETAVLGILSIIGFIAGGIVGLAWWLPMQLMSVPAIVGEGVGAARALIRANGLAKGARVRTTGIGLLAWFIMLLPILGMGFILGVSSPFAFGSVTSGASVAQIYVRQILIWVANILTVPFIMSVMVILYYERRVRVEGYDVEMASAALGVEVSEA